MGGGRKTNEIDPECHVALFPELNFDIVFLTRLEEFYEAYFLPLESHSSVNNGVRGTLSCLHPILHVHCISEQCII